jgi:putative phosphoribosyl transferase
MFKDREEAGYLLAQRLKGRAFHDPLVLAIPRGGIVVGAAIAQELSAELDVVLARKLGAPGQKEFALGAVSETGEVILNPGIEKHLRDRTDYLLEERDRQLEEIAQGSRLFRSVRSAAPFAGRSVILTDDGIATGSTMLAALRAVNAQKPREVIVVVPVAAPDRLKAVRPLCDEIVCLVVTPRLRSVSEHYRDFRQVEDEEVVALLRQLLETRR